MSELAFHWHSAAHSDVGRVRKRNEDAVLDRGSRGSGFRLARHGASAEPAAVEEALADFFAAALSGDPLMGEYAVGEAAGGAALRSLSDGARCPDAVTGEAHDDARVLSGALWSARVVVERERRRLYDVAVLEAARARSAPDDASFEALAVRLLAALSSRVPEGASALEAALRARGADGPCAAPRALSPAQTLSGSGGPFVAPGTRFP